MNQQDNKIIPLNIVMTYPVKWNKYKVFRDFLQNFYDAAGYKNWKNTFEYSYTNKTLSMFIKGIDFSYEWLLHIGASTKTSNPGDTAGYFGEGFKIATLCAIRDFNWQIKMASGNWELEAIQIKHLIDNRKVDILAYDLKTKVYQNISKLDLFPIENEDFELFKDVILSFYFYGNPLLGEKIWEGYEGAVYICNKNAYSKYLPYTYDFERNGAVFCAYQLLGSNPFGLVVCIHKYENEDRERRSLYSFDVVKIFKNISNCISPHGAIRVLEKMRRYWNSTSKRQIDIDSWSFTISNLIKNAVRSPEAVKEFREMHDNLLCLNSIRTVGDKNRRAQARAWLSTTDKKYLLVQKDFTAFGYPILEDVCEQCGGFVIKDSPTVNENAGFEILESITEQIYGDFFQINKNFPLRKIIQNEYASYDGMAKVFKKNKPDYNSKNIPIRYEVGEIYLKRSSFRKDNFYRALSTYIHELCHMFGGDSSNSFSLGLTFAMEMLLLNSEIIEIERQKWNCVFRKKFKTKSERHALLAVSDLPPFHTELFLLAKFLINMSKSDFIFCVLLNSSYSSSAFSFTCLFDIFPLSFKISYFLNSKKAFMLSANSSIEKVFSHSIKSSI